MGGQAGIAFLFLFAIFYCMGWNGLAWVICAEVRPLSSSASLTALLARRADLAPLLAPRRCTRPRFAGLPQCGRAYGNG